ncbi:MAG: ATP-binding protein [Malacoplasma sp.]|nr:ATP-binding protein [Malacoplasma sp.]
MYSNIFKLNNNTISFIRNFDIVHQDSLWKTYEGWFIGAIVVVSLLLIAYLAIVIYEKLYFFQIWEIVKRNPKIWSSVISSIVIILILACTLFLGEYGPLIICASAIGILFLSCIIFHSLVIFIWYCKYGSYGAGVPTIYESGSGYSDGSGYDDSDDDDYDDDDYDENEDDDDNYDNEIYDINPSSDEIKQLSKDQLIDYCQYHEIIGNYDRLKFYSRNKIIWFIRKWNSNQDVEYAMNYDLRSLNRTQLMTYLNILDYYYNRRMSDLQLACAIADIDYDNGKGLLIFFNLDELYEICEMNNITDYEDMEWDDLLDFLFNYNLKRFKITIKDNLTYINDSILWNTNVDTNAQKNENNATNSNASNRQTNNLENKNPITLKDIAGLDEVKKAFNEKVVLPIKYSHLYKTFNKNTGGGILLYGLPGTGKTLFAEAVSNEIDAKFFSIKCSDIKSMYIGESERKIKKLFKDARKEKRAVIFFDEFESIGKTRSRETLDAEATVPEILAQMQGVGTDNNNILIIAATNRPWDIDSALLRPGRFDEKIYVPLPDHLARKEIFKIKLKNIPHENIDFDLLASITNNCNGADISHFCERLKMSAINRSIESKQKQKINQIDIDKVKAEFKSSVSLNDLEEMKCYLEKQVK